MLIVLLYIMHYISFPVWASFGHLKPYLKNNFDIILIILYDFSW